MSWETFWQIFILIGWTVFVLTLAASGIIQELKK